MIRIHSHIYKKNSLLIQFFFNCKRFIIHFFELCTRELEKHIVSRKLSSRVDPPTNHRSRALPVPFLYIRAVVYVCDSDWTEHDQIQCNGETTKMKQKYTFWEKLSLKCVLVGDMNVGKSSLAARISSRTFKTDYSPTLFDNYAGIDGYGILQLLIFCLEWQVLSMVWLKSEKSFFCIKSFS